MSLRIWSIILLAALALFGAVIFFLSRDNIVFRFSESELQEKLEKRLPLRKSYLSLFDVTIDEPRIDLVEGSDRVAAGVDVAVEIRLAGREITLNGAADLSGTVRYLPERGEFYLSDPEVVGLRIQGLPERYSEPTHDVITLAMSEYVKTRPIYSLQGTKVSNKAARLFLRDVEVRDELLVVTLGLKKGSQ